MGCGSCGTTTDGKPSGCKSNGNCSSGGCNRKNTQNWMTSMAVADFGKPFPIIEVSFNNGSRKDFYNNHTYTLFEKGDYITVEGVSGYDVGIVSLTGEIVKLQLQKKGIKENSEDIKKVLRVSSPEEIARYNESKAKEKEMLIRARATIRFLKLEMKLTEVELQADAKKATFFYIADDRVDFRELIKLFANDFKVKVEMKQIGIRQEAAKVGGIGSCGRELCCSSWLSDFKGVSTLAARYQNLSINQTKLSGQCGRLKCCLNYELDTYMDSLKAFPDNADKLELATGIAYLQKKDIFRNLLWYSLAGSTKQYPLTIQRANEIVAMNQKGIKPEEMEAVEIESKKSLEEGKTEYVDLANAISLKTLDKANRKGRSNNKPQNKPRPNQGNTPNTENTKTPNPNNKPRPNNTQNPKPKPQNKPANTNPPQELRANDVSFPTAPRQLGGMPNPGTSPSQNPEKPKAEGSKTNNNNSKNNFRNKFKNNYGGPKPPKPNP